MKKQHEIILSKFIIEQLPSEYNLIISFDEIADMYFSSIVSVYKTNIDPLENIEYKYRLINRDEIGLQLVKKYLVVDNKTNVVSESELKLKDAIKINASIKVNDILEIPVNFSGEFSRSNINKIKSIFAQKCNILRNDQIYKLMEPLKGKIVIGIIDLVQKDFAKIKYENVYGFFPSNNQIRGEILSEGKPIELLVEDVIKSTTKTFPLVFSRNSVNFLIETFKDEIPEINDGVIEIIKVARMAGVRSKVIVKSNEALVDPIGSCVGKKGDRINSISRRCAHERIDLIKWSDDKFELLNNLFGNLYIYKILNMPNDSGYKLIVDDADINMAIGKFGSNIKLVKEILEKDVEIITLSDAAKEGYEIKEVFDDVVTNDLLNPNVTIGKKIVDKSEPEITKIQQNIPQKPPQPAKQNVKNITKSTKPSTVENKINVDINEILHSDEEKEKSNLEKKIEMENTFSKSKSDKKTNYYKKNKKVSKKKKKTNILDKIIVEEIYEDNGVEEVVENQFDDDDYLSDIDDEGNY